jgi:serine/threonine-protein kinase
MKVADKEYATTALDNPPQSMIDATYATVPNVNGQLQNDAVQHIQASDLNAAVVVTPIASTQPAGTVARTRPLAGQAIPRGTQVKIYISAGGMVRIPSTGVVGETVATATATLKALGFPQVVTPQPSQVQYMQHSATIPAGNVIGTVPGVGKSVDVRGAILLIISTGP